MGFLFSYCSSIFLFDSMRLEIENGNLASESESSKVESKSAGPNGLIMESRMKKMKMGLVWVWLEKKKKQKGKEKKRKKMNLLTWHDTSAC